MPVSWRVRSAYILVDQIAAEERGKKRKERKKMKRSLLFERSPSWSMTTQQRKEKYTTPPGHFSSSFDNEQNGMNFDQHHAFLLLLLF